MYVEFARTLGVEKINASLLIPHQGLQLEDETLDAGSDRVKRIISEAQAFACQHNILFEVPTVFSETPDDQLSRGKPSCSAPWKELFIRPDGRVHPCCFWGEQPIGNLTQQHFRDIWHGAEYERLRQELSSGNLREICARCPIFGLSTVGENLKSQ